MSTEKDHESWWLSVQGGRRRSAAPAGRWPSHLGPRARLLSPTSRLVGRIVVSVGAVLAGAYVLGVTPLDMVRVLLGV